MTTSYFIKIFGFSQTVISNITSLLSFLSLLILSIFPFSKKNCFWWLAPILYCSAPIINIFSNSFLCEPFSGLVILAFIYGYFKKRRSLFVFVSFTLAIMCKRENLVLFIVPLLDVLLSHKTENLKVKVSNVLAYVLIIILYLTFVQNVFGIENTESNDINAPTFAFDYFIKLFPVFIQSILNAKNFSILIYLVIIYIIYLASKKYLSKEKLIISCLFVLYLFLYSSHYRGYFFVKYGEISQFETFRYLNNFFVLVPLLLGDFFIKNKKSFYVVPVLLLCFSFVLTALDRYNYSEEEYISRFSNPRKVMDYIYKKRAKDPIIISDDILIYQNLCKPSLKVCDIRFMDRLNVLNLETSSIYLQIRNSELQDLRYDFSIPDKDLEQVLKLKGGYLYKYNPHR